MVGDIESFIQEGFQIGLDTNELNTIGRYYNSQFIAGEVHRDYLIWKSEVAKYLSRSGFTEETLLFGHVDSVPLIKGGLAYSDPESPQSQKLLSNIRDEINKKLPILRNLQGGRVITKGPDNEYRYNGKKIVFKGENTLYFGFFELLFCSSNEAVTYETLDELMEKIKKEKKSTLKEKKERITNARNELYFRSNLLSLGADKNMIVNVRGVGYRLNNPALS